MRYLLNATNSWRMGWQTTVRDDPSTLSVYFDTKNKVTGSKVVMWAHFARSAKSTKVKNVVASFAQRLFSVYLDVGDGSGSCVAEWLYEARQRVLRLAYLTSLTHGHSASPLARTAARWREWSELPSDHTHKHTILCTHILFSTLLLRCM